MSLQITTKSLPSACVGKPYSQTVAASGATGQVTWSVAPNLPDGLTLDAGTGRISGLSTALRTPSDFSFTATDGNGNDTCILSLGVIAVPAEDKSSSFLGAYLIAVALLMGYLVGSLWTSQQRAVALGPVACATEQRPSLKSIFPDHFQVGSGIGASITGCNFPVRTVVKINGAERSTLLIDSSHIHLTPNATDVAAPGPVRITMLTPEGAEFGNDTIWVVEPEFVWKLAFLPSWTISLELRLLLLAFFTGAFASSIYAVKSLADYRGDGTFAPSWSMYYLVQPIEGAGAAFLFYVAIRGGLLTGGSGDVRAVNIFGICALTGLAGAFSDLAFMKLREVFQTLFKPQDARTGKLDGIKITTFTLPGGVSGQSYDLQLESTGGTAPLAWAVSPALPSGLKLDAASGRVSGTPASPMSKRDFTFTVTDSASPPNSSKVALSLTIS
jgi:hypothetical protein